MIEVKEKISLREAFGKALIEAGERWSDLRVLDAGTSNSTMSKPFRDAYPERFYTPGINEPGMLGLATGIAMNGNRVVAADMSVFLHHAYGQIRAAVRQGDLHLVIAASHTGIAVGPDGGSAHDITDVARMRLIPDIKVVTPWDGNQVKNAMRRMMEVPGIYYLRLNRPALPVFTMENTRFDFNRAYKLRVGEKLTIIAMGDKVGAALTAADALGDGFADVIGISTVEPLDKKTILESVRKTGRVVTIEDHMYIGGLFEQIAGVLAEHHPAPVRKIALGREITTSGDPDDLAQLYEIDTDSIIRICREFAEGKGG